MIGHYDGDYRKFIKQAASDKRTQTLAIRWQAVSVWVPLWVAHMSQKTLIKPRPEAAIISPKMI